MEKRHGLDMTAELLSENDEDHSSFDMSSMSLNESGEAGAMSRVACLICRKEVCSFMDSEMKTFYFYNILF